MTEFQFAFLCLFGLAILIMVVGTHNFKADTLYDSAQTYTLVSEDTQMPTYTYTASAESAPAQTAIEFARVYGRVAVLAAEQMAMTGKIEKASRNEKALEILKLLIKAQGYDDPDGDEDVKAALPYIIEFSVYEEFRQLF